MRIKELEINHFRNLLHHYIKFSESNITAFVGINSSGKTSILDAIALSMEGLKTEGIKGIFENDLGEILLDNQRITFSYLKANRFVRRALKVRYLNEKSMEKFVSIAKDFYKDLNRNLINVDITEGVFNFIFSDSYRFTMNQLGLGCRVFLSTIISLLSTIERNVEVKPIILIDELEIHLHPSVHRILVEILKKYFSDIQFVITTNSPVLISQLSNEEVRLINSKNFQLSVCEYHTFGTDINRILQLVFDTNERPNDIKSLFEQFSFKIAERNFSEAKEILAKLKSIVGELDSEVVGCQVTLDLEKLDEQCFGDKHKK